MRVGTMIRELLDSCSGSMHAKRLAAVANTVEAIIRSGRLVPAKMGRRLPGRRKAKHGIKCVDRLLGNRAVGRHRMFIFLAVAHRLLHGCREPEILIDWTQAGGTHEALVAAVPIGGRAVPIYVEVHPQKLLGNAAVENQFLQSLRAVIPAECRPVIVTDAGFKGPLFQAILDLGWNFCGRVRGTAKAISHDTGLTVAKEDFYAQASTTPKDLGTFGLFVVRPIPCRLILVRRRRKPGRKPPPPKCKEERELRKAALDPWLLATSMPDGDAARIVGIYKRRMQIEETFRDAKSHRFGWSMEDVRLSTPERTAMLLLLATVALLVITLIGMGAEHRGIHRAYQANTTKRRVLSFFTLACLMLDGGDRRALSGTAFLNALASARRAASA
jgi:hypothetical protein